MYSPKVTREQATAEQTRKFLRVCFLGNLSLLISNLVDSGEADVEEIQAILDMVRRQSDSKPEEYLGGVSCVQQRCIQFSAGSQPDGECG